MSIPIVEWQGCYSTMWKGLLVNASYSHPAKFSPGLIERILRHGVERGWWQRGGAKSVTAEIQEEIAEAIKRRDYVALCRPPTRAAAKPRRSRSSAQGAEAATPANISGKTLSVMDAGPRIDGRQSYVTSSGYVLHGSDGPGVPSIGDTVEIQPSRIGDPFGGVATGGVIAQGMGLAWVGLELEEKFVEIGRRNIDLSAHRCESLGLPVAVLLQGDSRAFCETVAGYAGTARPDGRKRAMQGVGERYGATAGQIGSLRTGVVDGIVSSPPYCDSRIGKTGPGSVQDENLRRPSFREECYGGEAAQIGNLAAGKVETAMRGPLTGHCACGSVLGSVTFTCVRGKHCPVSGKVDAVVTSPPWEKGCEGAVGAHKFKDPEKFQAAKRGNGASDEARRAQLARDKEKTYGASEGQIGILNGETCLVCGIRLQPSECQPVKIAELLSIVEAAGVSGATVATSAGQASQKAKSTKRKSLPLTPGSPANASAKIILTGMEEAAGGEGTHGACNGAQPCAETEAAASSAGLLTTSLSTTSRTEKKPVESGITALAIFRRFAEAATPKSTHASTSASITCCAKCAGLLTSRGSTAAGLALRVAERLATRPSTTDGAPKIGREAGETYWEAMRAVWMSCFRSLKPGGVMAVVVKDYVKRKKRVTLCDDTLRLLEHVGFVAVERIHAMLVETKTEDGLFGAIETTKERKSFFRRVHEQKGAERIDWEEVLIVRKP